MIVKSASGSISIPNRRDVDYAQLQNLPEISAVAESLPNDTVLDVELACLDKDGRADTYEARVKTTSRCGTENQGRIPTLMKETPIYAFAFDLIRFNGEDVSQKSFLERKLLLKIVVEQVNSPHLKLVWYVRSGFRDFYNNQMEGAVLKRIDSKYVEGRWNSWLKCKHFQFQWCSVAGYTEGKGRNQQFFGALILLNDAGDYVGKVGCSGFNDYDKMKVKQLLQTSNPTIPSFELRSKVGESFTQVTTDLKVQVRFTELTDDGLMYQPVKIAVSGLPEPESLKYPDILQQQII